MEQDPGELAWLIPLEEHTVWGAPAGSLVPVFPGATLGRGDVNDLRLARASRVHAQLGRTRGEWFVNDVQSTEGTFVNGASVRRGPAMLQPGAVVRCAEASFRFELAPDGPGAPWPLEEQLRARPHDEALWVAAADRWLEQDVRWGSRIVAHTVGFPEEDTLLNAAVRSLGLEVQWRQGFVRRARIRSACVRAGLSPEVVLAALLTHPLARFLEQLELDGLRLFDLNDDGRAPLHREDASRGFLALLRRWLPAGVSNLELGVGLLGTQGELALVAEPLARARPALRQRYWLHGTMRLDPGGEVSPVFGAELDCQGKVRCAFELLRGGTQALTVLDDVPVVIRAGEGELRGGRGMRWFPGEELEVAGSTLRFSEHTQTLIVVTPHPDPLPQGGEGEGGAR